MKNISIADRVGRDPEIRYLDSGSQICNFSVAVNRYAKDKDNPPPPIWFQVSMWGKQAQAASDYVTKGMWVAGSGELDIEEYTGRDDGERRYRVKVNGSTLTLGPNAEARKEPSGYGSDCPSDEEVPF